MTEYVKTKYLDDNGLIHPIRLTLPFFYWSPSPPTGVVTSPIPAMVTKGRQRSGLRPRGFRLYRFVGDEPNKKIVYGFSPQLTREWFDADWAVPNINWGVNGLPWKVHSLVPEDY